MKVKIVDQQKELQVIIECQKLDEKVTRLKSHIELFDNKLQAKSGGETCFVHSADVLYFETVDNRMFLYTNDSVMEIRQRLYELEAYLPSEDFIRISKSQIVNVNKIKSLKPEINRTILATLCNGEQLYISRKYVKAFRELLNI